MNEMIHRGTDRLEGEHPSKRRAERTKNKEKHTMKV